MDSTVGRNLPQFSFESPVYGHLKRDWLCPTMQVFPKVGQAYEVAPVSARREEFL
jgi:hypothetical protein